jgi:type IX secretion system substrate protein
MGLNFTKTTISNGGSITDIEVDPSNPQNLWICSQGYGSSVANVYKSTDGGVTVTPIPNFPANLGCNAIVRQHSTGKIFVGTDQGVVFTEDNGQNWYTLPDGMPNVPVNSMKIKGLNEDKLLAGTYGRGMFWLDLKDLIPIGVDPVSNPNDVIRFVSTYPNPVVGNKATIAFEMKDAGIMTSSLLDVLGREVKVLEKATYASGKHQFEFTTEGLVSGTYIVLLTANGTTVSERIIVN